MKYNPNSMKFDTQSRSSFFIINMIFEIPYFDPKLKMTLIQNYKFAKFGPKTEMCTSFYEIWHFWQIEHANDEYGTWDWRFWAKAFGFG